MTADFGTVELHGTRSLEAWAAEAEAAAALARQFAPTAFMPASLRVIDRETGEIDLDATTASGAAALLTGQELGLSPMASLRSIDIIPPGSGSPALRANTMRALALAAGHDIWMPERATDTRCVMRGRRAGTDFSLEPQETIWTMDRVAKMRLRGFASPDSHWKRQPRTMLIARATAEIVRLVCPDVLLGLPYAVEELDDAGSPDLGVEGEPDNAANPPRAVPARRNTRPRRNAPTARSRAGSPAAALPASPEPPGSEDAPPEAEPAGEPQPMINASQRARLWAGLRRLGLTEREPALEQIGKWITPPREVESSNALTEAEASDVISAIEAEQLRRDAKRAAEDAEALAAAEDARRAAAAAEDESQEIPDHD